MGSVVHIDTARRRRYARERTCDRCPDPAYEGGLCAWHFALIEIEAAELQVRRGERCCDERCRQPIPPRQMRVVLPDGKAMHVCCAMAAIEAYGRADAEGAR